MNENKQQQDWKELSKENEVTLKKFDKWKSPGISGYYLFSKGHSKLTSAPYDIFEIPGRAPKWLSEGVAYLL